MRNASLFRMVFVGLLLCSTMLTRADKKICLLADTHVLSPLLTVDPDELANGKTMQELSVPIFDQLIQKVINDRPDALLICGDLTRDGEPESHEYVVNKLTEVKSEGIPVFVIPGNHDYAYGEEDGFRQTYRHFGYGDDCEQDANSLSYATSLFPGLTLIGIGTEKQGHARSRSIRFASEQAKAARERGDEVIVMVHQSLIPHFYGQEAFMPFSTIDNGEILRDSLINAGVKVVFTGHYHVTDNTRYTDALGREIYDLCTGSPIAYPCDYRILTFDDDVRTLKITTESVTSLEGYDNFPAYAKDRLQEAFQTWAANWFAEHDVNELVAATMSQSLADAFVIHAEGDEPMNPATARTLAVYEDLLALAPMIGGEAGEKISEICLSIKSMLGDYPSEAETDNIVEDLTLSIPLSGEPAGIRSLLPTTGETAPWYTLQGQRLNGRPSGRGVYVTRGRKTVIHANNK